MGRLELRRRDGQVSVWDDDMAPSHQGGRFSARHVLPVMFHHPEIYLGHVERRYHSLLRPLDLLRHLACVLASLPIFDPGPAVNQDGYAYLSRSFSIWAKNPNRCA